MTNTRGSFAVVAAVFVTLLCTSLARAGEIVHEAVVDAPVADVWKAFTDPAEISTWMVKKCDVDLRIGGLLRTSYNPEADLGGPESIHHEILSFEPQRMLSFRTIKAPEGFPHPNLIGKTWVVATFESIGTHKTRVRLAMCGYGEGGEWDEMREKFEAGNKWTMDQLRKKFERKIDGEVWSTERETAHVLALLNRLIGGQWKHDGKAPDGTPFIVTNNVRHGPDGKTFVANGSISDGEESIEHSSMLVFADPGTGDVRFVSTNEIGDMAEGPITVVDYKTIEWDWQMRGKDNHDYSVLMTFPAKDEYIFKLRLRKDDGTLEELISADFHRQSAEEKKTGASKPNAEYESSGATIPKLTRIAAADESFASYRAHLAAANAALKENNVSSAKRWLAEAPEEHRGWEWNYLLGRTDQSGRVIQPGEGAIEALAISPDGSRMAVGTANNIVAVIDINTGNVIEKLTGHEKAIFDVTFSRDGTKLASSSRDKTIRIWNAKTFEHIKTLTDPDSHVMGLAFNPDGTKLAASILSYVRIWNVEAGEIERTLKGHVEKPPVVAVDWSADGKSLVSASWDNWCIDWNLETGESMYKFGPGYGGEEYVRFQDVAISPDGKSAAGAGGNGSIQIWNLETGETVCVLKACDLDILCVAFDPQGKSIAAGVMDGSVQLWDLASQEITATLRGHNSQVRDLTFLPDGNTLVTVSVDETIRFWSTNSRKYQTAWSAGEEYIWQAEFLPNHLIALASNDNSVYIMNPETQENVAKLEGHDAPAIAVRASRDGKRLVSSSNDGTARVWNLTTNQCEHVLKGHNRVVSQASISPDGSRVVTAGYDGTIRLWNADTGEQISQIDNKSLRVCYTPDGTMIAAGGGDGVLRFYRSADLSLMRECSGHAGSITAVAISRDGTHAGTAGDDRTVRLWNIATGECISVMDGHNETPYGLTFSPDGSRIASGGYDRTIRLWDVQPPGVGEEVLTLSDQGDCWALEWSPDGKTIIAPLLSEKGRITFFTTP